MDGEKWPLKVKKNSRNLKGVCPFLSIVNWTPLWVKITEKVPLFASFKFCSSVFQVKLKKNWREKITRFEFWSQRIEESQQDDNSAH